MGYLQGFDDCDAASDVVQELRQARALHPKPFNSAHEGYAVLREEVDELWDEIKCRKRDVVAIRAEAVQIAAMAICFIEDICDQRGV